jgi:hypothetical protein
MFRHRGAILMECSEQRSKSPIHQYRYCVAFLAMIKILKIKNSKTNLTLCVLELQYFNNSILVLCCCSFYVVARFMLLLVLWLFYSWYVLLSILCVLYFCIVLCIVSPYVYRCFFSTCVQCTDHCHRVKTQSQLINIISYIYIRAT